MSLPSPTSENRAVVTGASSGIGMALAAELASRGYSLILVARRGELLTELAERLTLTHGITAEVRAVDLSDREARRPLVEELAKRDIAILVNNAGVATFGPLAKLDLDYERAIMELNAVAVQDLSLAVLPGMIERRGGGILITGSAAGNMPIPNNATYAASKAFTNTWAESLRGEMKEYGVHVTLLAPGPVRTDNPDQEEVSTKIPEFIWVTAEHTAQITVDALAKNKMRVVPGLISKGMSLAGQYGPRAITSVVAGAAYKRLSG
ncbi:mycolate reductase [Nocardia goodfellowii]|uniref:Short-subunit dehydrogenase n=1 Tax=Nocardia goodfellowii TaxID=882446 RepID=A0ABS4QRC2_9NOCA|nr:mycolate reductase [Nocardia goodfellowii]MBP2194266.1 short-subunit dehydrogenase [Nocardia goodfellowii]